MKCETPADFDNTVPQHNFFLMIPATIADDPEIDDATAMLFGRIAALSNQKGYCWASDEYLAQLTRVSDREIRYRLTVLEDKGYIKKETLKKGMYWDRKIYPIFDNKRMFTKGSPVPDRKAHLFRIERLTCSGDIDKSNNKIKDDIYKQQQRVREPDPPQPKDCDSAAAAQENSAASAEIRYETTKGDKRHISVSEIYRHFCALPYATETIKAAIEQFRKERPQVNNILKLLESICQRLEKPCKKPEKKPLSKPEEAEMTKEEIDEFFKNYISLDQFNKNKRGST